MADRWYSVDEITEHLGIKRDTVYKWVRMQSMPSHRVGRLLKFQVTEVDQWVRDGQCLSAIIITHSAVVMQAIGRFLKSGQLTRPFKTSASFIAQEIVSAIEVFTKNLRFPITIKAPYQSCSAQGLASYT